MAALKALVRYFSYLFHGLLALLLLAISGLTLASGDTLHLGMLPWTGATLAKIVFCAALGGLISLVLAIRGTWSWLFFLWCLAVLVLMVKGYVFGGYHFAPGEARRAGYLMLAALISVLGGWWSMWRDTGPKARY